MLVLIAIVLISILISFLCSIFEAVLLCVTPSYIETLAQTRPVCANRLRHQRNNIESPLVAILTLNTIAHTVGAAMSGAQAAIVFGSELVGVFSGVLTFLILFFSEIIPKTLGANYWRRLAPSVSLVLFWLERIAKPLIWLSKRVTRLLGKGDEGQYIRQELSALAKIGKELGELDGQEARILTQMLTVKSMPVTTIMTPRVVTFSVPINTSPNDFIQQYPDKPFTRIPVYEKDPDDIIGYVNRVDILLAKSSKSLTTLYPLKKNLLVIPATAKILPLFELMLKHSKQMAIVADEYGCALGIVTQEDIIESILGLEIVDTKDPAIDMQQLARNLWKERMQAKGIKISDDPSDNTNEANQVDTKAPSITNN